jgi:hypothetical protein
VLFKSSIRAEQAFNASGLVEDVPSFDRHVDDLWKVLEGALAGSSLPRLLLSSLPIGAKVCHCRFVLIGEAGGDQ